ncbi:MAG: hypothetical protein QOJ95_2700 [Mycobacterium sp.]|nr:hypothetical protein [Mycobacterium sp.]
MIPTFVLVYLGGWVITTLATFVAGRRLADGPTTPVTSLGFSLLAGLVWPLMIVGVVELSSVAVYSTAKSRRHHPEIPESWLRVGALDDVVVPLR